MATPTPFTLLHPDDVARQRERAATTLPCRWGDSPLRTAVKRGQVFKALRILERDRETRGIDPVSAVLTPDAQGVNLLHLAVQYSHPAMLEALEARSASRAAAAAPDRGLLALAIERHVSHRRYHHRQLAMVEHLLARGERPHEGTAPEPWPNLLIGKQQYAVFDHLIGLPEARGWAWDRPLPSNGRQAYLPLSSLVLQSSSERFEKAVAAGAPLLPAPGTWSAAHVAASQGRGDELGVLLDLEPALLQHRNPDGDTVVHLMVHHLAFNHQQWPRRIAGFEALLARTTPHDVNAFDGAGRTPFTRLLDLCLNRLSARMDRARELVERLVEAGADVTLRSPGAPGVHAMIDRYQNDGSGPEQVAMGHWLRALCVEPEMTALRAVADGQAVPPAPSRGRPRF